MVLEMSNSLGQKSPGWAFPLSAGATKGKVQGRKARLRGWLGRGGIAVIRGGHVMRTSLHKFIPTHSQEPSGKRGGLGAEPKLPAQPDIQRFLRKAWRKQRGSERGNLTPVTLDLG